MIEKKSYHIIREKLKEVQLHYLYDDLNQTMLFVVDIFNLPIREKMRKERRKYLRNLGKPVPRDLIESSPVVEGMTDTRIDNLIKMTIIFFWSLFESFVKDSFRVIYINKPETMKSEKKMIGIESLIGLSSTDELNDMIANELVDDIGYKDIDKLTTTLKQKFNIDFKKFRFFDDLRETQYRRNIIVHNSGKISKIYISKLNLDKSRIGEILETNKLYLGQCFTRIKNAMVFLTEEFCKLFGD